MIYKFTITSIKGEVLIEKYYCYLSKFDAKVQSSVLFLLSAEKDKKKPNKELIELLKKELKTDLDYITNKSDLLKYLNRSTFVKDYYGESGRFYKLSLVESK